jgi:hypothetical protein
MLVAHYIGMVQLLHDCDFLVDVLLKEGFLLYVHLADDLHRVKDVITA